MALAIPTDYYHALIPFKHVSLAREAAVTIGVHDTLGSQDPEDVADIIVNELQTAMASVIDDDVTVGPALVSFGPAGAGRGSVSGTASFTGGADRNSVAPNTALLVRKTTTRPGRAGRGRMFFPWTIDQTSVNEVGIINTTTVTALQTAVGAWRAGMLAEFVAPVLLHQENTPGGSNPDEISALVVDNRIGTQRRRNR